MAREKSKFDILLRPYIVIPLVAALILVAAIFWYPPLYQAGYGPADEAPFFTQQGEGIDINSAGVAELTALPGIGEVKAQAILDYRAEHGPFESIEEIMEVKGIGPGIFEQIRELIVV